MDRTMYDIIIVGGGPAGLTAAIYALRAGKTVLLLEKDGFGGQIATSPRVDNFPGCPSVSGAQLADTMVSQVLDLGGELDIAEVLGVRCEDGHRFVLTGDGELEARSVIIAVGAGHRKLGLPREEELTGSGVSYCAVCDGAFFKDRPVAVVGGGDTALQEALELSGLCSQVYLIHRRDTFRAEDANVKAAQRRENIHFLTGYTVDELEGEIELTGVTIRSCKDGQREILPVDGLFISIGFESANSPFKQIASLDKDGWFDSDENCATVTPGVFAAGDCRAKPVRQLTTAVADGAVAALAACRYLDGGNSGAEI